MLAEEIRQARIRAAAQAATRDARYANRSISPLSVPVPSTISNMSVTTSSDTPGAMEQPQYAHVISSIPTFSGEPHENVHDWIDIISLKFDILAYDDRQKRRFIPQYLAGTALKWHITHRESVPSWDEYIPALTAAFPHTSTTSRDMNLKMLRDRKQGPAEAFTEYYTSTLALCHQHDSGMGDLQIIDWLKAGMTLKLYERLQGENFTTPHALLTRAQHVELDQAVLDARKRDCAALERAVLPRASPPSSNRPQQWNPSASVATRSPPFSYSTSYPSPFSSSYPSSYPPPLMPTSSFAPSYNNGTSGSRFTNPSYFSPSSTPSPSANLLMPPRRPIICYSCGQPGHISPHCPNYPKD